MERRTFLIGAVATAGALALPMGATEPPVTKRKAFMLSPGHGLWKPDYMILTNDGPLEDQFRIWWRKQPDGSRTVENSSMPIKEAAAWLSKHAAVYEAVAERGEGEQR